MEGLKSEAFSTVSEDSVMQRLYSKTSFYPATIEQSPPRHVTKVNSCSCGDRSVTIYCRTHETLLCKPCKYKNHARCHLANIERVAKGVLDLEELKLTIKELTTLKNVFEKIKENKRLTRLRYRQQKKSLLKLSRRWNMLQSTRNALNKEVELGIDQVGDEVEKHESVIVRKSRWVLLQVKEYINELNDNIEKGDETMVYILLHRERKDLIGFRNILNAITEDQSHSDIYEGIRTIVSGIYHCENQGNVSLSRALKPNVRASKSRLHEHNFISTPSERSKSSNTFRRHSRLSSASWRFRPAFRPQTIRMPTLVSSLRSGQSSRALTNLTKTSIALRNRISDRIPKEFRINTSSDKVKNYHVTAMRHLHDDKLLVMDCRNNKLKLFSNDNNFITELDLQCSVWDFTMTAKSEVLITCPGEGKLQHVKITVGPRDCELAKTSYISTQKDCRALFCVASRIYVSYAGEKPCIKILSKDGIIYRTIDAYKGKATLFKNPLFMHVSKLGKLIYVSDYSLQRVTKIDQKGNLHGVIDLSPGWPLNLCMTREEKLLVAVSGTSDIRVIPPGSSKCHILIKPRVLDGDPCFVTVKETHDFNQQKQVYVAYAENGVVKIFTMA